MAEHDTSHIVQSLIANFGISVAKGVAAAFTKSGAMLAETLHSLADCGNQLLLLLGVKRSQKPPDELHPLGYGRALYFWSFMVAMLLFMGGGGFSIYEGIHKIQAPEPVTKVWIGMAVLAVAIAIEGWATINNIREIGRRRGSTPMWRYLRDTKDSDLVVVFGENSAAVLGLFLAMIAMMMAGATGDGRWDGVGSLAIGLVLVAVAVFLAVEVKSLLVGERADPAVEKAIREIFPAHEHVEEVLQVVTVQQGPGEVLVAMKVKFKPDVPAEQLSRTINQLEAALREKQPHARWCFVEPGAGAAPAAGAEEAAG